MIRLRALLAWLALPVYVWQGVRVRLSVERLIPPESPHSGQSDGAEPVIRLLVIGDSSAASVGVDGGHDGLASRLATRIAEKTGRGVVWRAAGFNSATAGELRDFVVPNLEPAPYTHIVLAVGTNDVKNFHSGRRFKREFGGLLYALKARWPDSLIFWSPVIDMRKVPALPRLLGTILEARAALLNRIGTTLCRERRAIPAARLPVEDPRGFARDGFHASAAGYDIWAGHLVPFLLLGD